MNEIVGVSLNENNRIEYFYTNDLNIKKNLTVIVETENGLKFGKVITTNHPINKNQLEKKLYKVVRIASKQDYYNNQKNIKDASLALKKSISLVNEYDLDMNIISCEYTFDRDKLIFKFLSDKRIDFRDLARDLASIYHTRIELRQIGVRDKAKEIGGMGVCGQKLCCSRFLKEFEPVSISMAKNQNLALNPNKINGICGRLLCCLQYEDKNYKNLKNNMPKIGQVIKVNGAEGRVISINLLKQTFRVDTQKGIIEEKINGSD